MGETRLLYYYPLATETWIIIFSAWICFIIGSITYPMFRITDSNSHKENIEIVDPTTNLSTVTVIRNGILLLSGIALLSGIQEWMILINKFGSISKVIVYGNLVYSYRISDGGVGIPYADSLALPASFLSGVYASYKKRITIISLLPIFTVIMIAIAGMGRAQILISLILFSSGYLLSKNIVGVAKESFRTKIRSVFSFLVVLIIVLIGAETVRSNRGTIESISGASRTLNKLRGGSVITPSIYLYFSIHPFVLDQYLKGTGESGIIGGNTFAPFWRILNKMGFDTYVHEYQTHYNTPTGSNTGTYIRELHSDFGLIGIFIVPYLLGFLCSRFWFRWIAQKKIIDLTLLSHLYVIVALSYLVMATRLGYWLVSLIASLIVSVIIDSKKSSIINKNIPG